MMTRTTMFALMSAVCASIVPANSLKLKPVRVKPHVTLADVRQAQTSWLEPLETTAAYMDSPERAARFIQRFKAISPASSVAASPPTTPPVQVDRVILDSSSPPPLPSRPKAKSRSGSPRNLITQETLHELRSKGLLLSQQFDAGKIAAREPGVSPTASIDTSIVSMTSSPSTSPLLRPQPVLHLPRSPFTFKEFSPGKRTIPEDQFLGRWPSTSSPSPEKKLKTSANDSSHWHS